MSKPNYILDMYQKLQRLPLGNKLFSAVFARKAPYFGTIHPQVVALRPNYAEVQFAKRRGVENHIGTVHVIAICNGLEMAMGALAEATIPSHLRWIPKGMEVNYTAKATSDIRCIAETDPEAWGRDPNLPVRVKALRDDGTVVVEGVIHLWVTEKPARA